MMQTIYCYRCHKGGLHEVHFNFMYQQRSCGTCHHTNLDEWQYWFCTADCLCAWLKENEVEQKGIPCRSCANHRSGEPTGFANGFEQNGVCKICEGKLRVMRRAGVELGIKS
jgi:hypothetical protein